MTLAPRAWRSGTSRVQAASFARGSLYLTVDKSVLARLIAAPMCNGERMYSTGTAASARFSSGADSFLVGDALDEELGAVGLVEEF